MLKVSPRKDAGRGDPSFRRIRALAPLPLKSSGAHAPLPGITDFAKKQVIKTAYNRNVPVLNSGVIIITPANNLRVDLNLQQAVISSTSGCVLYLTDNALMMAPKRHNHSPGRTVLATMLLIGALLVPSVGAATISPGCRNTGPATGLRVPNALTLIAAGKIVCERTGNLYTYVPGDDSSPWIRVLLSPLRALPPSGHTIARRTWFDCAFRGCPCIRIISALLL